MNIPNIEQLNTQFSFSSASQQLSFNMGEGGIPIVEIRNEQATATISLQGAHLLSWKPNNKEDVIWLSDDAKFVEGKSVRGGIPLCWPWFGAHHNDNSFPAHGFARTVYWQVKDVQNISKDETRITFLLETKHLNNISNMWPLDTSVEYTISVSKDLTLDLTTYNQSTESITIGQALHTYFNVADITNTAVYGLEDKSYLDKPDDFKLKKQSGPLHFNSEVDRVYLKTSDDIIIDNNKRKILITKKGSESTVVWNPWETVANKMGDLGELGYLRMLCVESANAAEDTITIEPNKSHNLHVTYSLM